MLLRYHPWQELNDMQRQLERLFTDKIPNELLERELIKSPAAELKETDEAIYLKLELPGMSAKDLDIQVTKNSVSIAGERKNTSHSHEEGVTKSEFFYGKFQRVIPLPSHVQNTQVVADYQDGILSLTLPKVQAEQNKVFKVNLG